MGAKEDKRAVVPSGLVLRSPVHFLAFGFGSGLSPVAPGTMGTVVGIPVFLLLMALPLTVYLIVVTLLCVVGCWICGESAKRLGVHDHGGIVFDEITSYLISALPLLPALGWVTHTLWAWLLLTFALFRLFDIWKPWPIAWLDRRVHGGVGIMLDDVIAGFYSVAVLLAVIYGLHHGGIAT